ncbi:MAG: T9SS type A sorting domain-containing protein [Bacteroidales bacterium]|nr:T9SS type A sorting domain-containing protein [Bacteroidales bacterium]
MKTSIIQLRKVLYAVLFVLLSVVGMTNAKAQGSAPTGAINGLFSVSDSTQVYFSQGNLQYIGSAATPYWKFADHQWDYFGDNGQGSTSATVDRDLFGWGTSGYNHGATYYQPWSTETQNRFYYAYGNWIMNLYDGNGQAEWGYNAISNGGNTENSGWRTLTTEEWDYLFNTRSTTSEVRYAKATVNNVSGAILLPDNWTTSIYTLDTSGTEYTSNTITIDDWTNVLEANGAVFLPAAGNREGTSVTTNSSAWGPMGWYWSSSYLFGSRAYYVAINEYAVWTNNEGNRYNGKSVRLVRNAEPEPEPHGYIDLGLPSGTLWATCNVGANSPEEYGDYFAWGETQTKDVYNWETYQYYDGNNLTKYSGSDGLTTLLPEDDAATANWGNGWRMPTKEEFQELYNNATITWTQQDGVNGCLFTASNGNSLFLPASGSRSDNELGSAGIQGNYWSSSLHTDYTECVWYFSFFYAGNGMGYSDNNRYKGYTVRPVREVEITTFYEINATPSPIEGGTIEGVESYAEGSTCILTATPAEGYTFINWTENGAVVSSRATYSFTVTEDRNLVANFMHVLPSLCDDFNDGVINLDYWTATGPNIYEEEGMVKIQQNQTDVYVALESQPMSLPSNNRIFMERRFLIHEQLHNSYWGEHYYYGGLQIRINGSDSDYIGIAYLDDDYDNRHGTYLSLVLDGVATDTRFCDASFDTWLEERIEVDLTDETLSYYLDNTLVSTLSIQGVANQQMDYFTAWFNSSGWWTGHYHNMDYVNINPLSEGLIAYYPFDGDANDYSGNGNHGTIIGNVVSVTDRHGNANGAYRFPGSAFNYISVPDAECLHLSNFTLSAWVYTDADNYGSGYLINKGRDINNGSYRLTVTGVGATTLYGGTNDAAVEEEPSVGQWHMVTGTVEGDQARYYLDGVLMDERTLSYPFSYDNSEPLTLGCHYYSGVPSNWAYTLLGVLDEVRIYNRVLTPEEVQMLYGYTVVEITATSNPEEGGTVSGAGLYSHGDTCTLTATPNASYTFINWTENGEVVSTEASYSFIVVSDRNLVANFMLPLNIITSVMPEESGTVTGAGEYDYGTECTLTATPSEDYYFVKWTKDGHVVSTQSTYSFIATEEGNYMAHFALKMVGTVTANYNPDPDDNQSPNVRVSWIRDSNMYEEFESGDFNLHAWEFPDSYPWVITDNNPYEGSFCMKSNNGGAHSTSSTIKTTIFIPSEGQMSFYSRISSESRYDYGRFYIDGQEMGNWSGNGGWEQHIYDITSGQHTFMWAYTKDVSVNSNDDCFYVDNINFFGATRDGTRAVHHYEVYRSELPENDTWELLADNLSDTTYVDTDWSALTEGWYKYGVVAYYEGFDTIYPTYMARSNRILRAYPHTITVAASPEEGGVVTGAGDYVLYTECTLTATPNEDYYFVNWTKNEAVVSAYSSFSFVVTEDAEYVAHFALRPVGMVTAMYDPDPEDNQSSNVRACWSMDANMQEGFESGDFSQYDWETNWVITSNNPYEGNYCMSSSNHDNYSSSYAQVTIDIPAAWQVSFWSRISSESSYDYGRFYIDDQEMGAWSGNGVWEQHIYDVTVGEHTLKWSYSKDISVSNNDDCFYVDNISFVGAARGSWTANHYKVYRDTYPSNGSPELMADYVTDTTFVDTGWSGLEEGWYRYGVKVSYSDNDLSRMVWSNRILRASPHTIIATANPEEGGSVTGAGEYVFGTECTLTAIPNEGWTFVNWTENGNEVSTEASYIFTVMGDRNLVANFTLPFTITASAVPEEGGSVTGAGDYNNGTECTLTATANEGYEFLYWTEDGIVVSSNASYSFIVTDDHNFVAYFAENIQPISLGAGWNWISTYIEQEGVDGLAMLEEGLGSNGVMIKSQADGFLSYANGMWIGTLDAITNEKMYLVSTSEASEFTITGSVSLLNDHPITLNPNWTWVGYPSPFAMDVSDALANLNPAEGDLMKSQSCFATYSAENGWYGSLNTLTPGLGFMYQSHNSQAITLTFSVGVNRSLRTNVTAENNHWVPDIHAYPNNMSIMAVVELDGAEIHDERYELAAFSGDECRGSARLVYVKPIRRYVAFLSVVGDEDAELSLALYDTMTNEAYFNTKDVLNFEADAVLGSLRLPFVARFGAYAGLDGFDAKALILYPNPVTAGHLFHIELPVECQGAQVSIIDAFGSVISTTDLYAKLAILAAPNVPGVYTVRLMMGKHGTYCRKLIVK